MVALASTQSTVDDLIHDVRNGLAGVHAAIRIVRDSLMSCDERDILNAAMSRIDDLSRQLIQERQQCHPNASLVGRPDTDRRKKAGSSPNVVSS
jgi:hypothetical protein